MKKPAARPGSPKKKGPAIQKKLDDLMSAITFAEAGEHDTAREMLGATRTVLVAVREGDTSGSAFVYAKNVCKRLKARLDILLVSQKRELMEKLSAFLAGLDAEGIAWRLTRKNGCLKNQIVDYASANKDVIFVITESYESLELDCRRKELGWNNLNCPLVVVSGEK